MTSGSGTAGRRRSGPHPHHPPPVDKPTAVKLSPRVAASPRPITTGGRVPAGRRRARRRKGRTGPAPCRAGFRQHRNSTICTVCLLSTGRRVAHWTRRPRVGSDCGGAHHPSSYQPTSDAVSRGRRAVPRMDKRVDSKHFPSQRGGPRGAGRVDGNNLGTIVPQLRQASPMHWTHQGVPRSPPGPTNEASRRGWPRLRPVHRAQYRKLPTGW